MLQKERAAGSCTSGLGVQGDLGPAHDLEASPLSMTRVLSASQRRASAALVPAEPGKQQPQLGSLR